MDQDDVSELARRSQYPGRMAQRQEDRVHPARESRDRACTRSPFASQITSDTTASERSRSADISPGTTRSTLSQDPCVPQRLRRYRTVDHDAVRTCERVDEHRQDVPIEHPGDAALVSCLNVARLTLRRGAGLSSRALNSNSVPSPSSRSLTSRTNVRTILRSVPQPGSRRSWSAPHLVGGSLHRPTHRPERRQDLRRRYQALHRQVRLVSMAAGASALVPCRDGSASSGDGLVRAARAERRATNAMSGRRRLVSGPVAASRVARRRPVRRVRLRRVASAPDCSVSSAIRSPSIRTHCSSTHGVSR